MITILLPDDFDQAIDAERRLEGKPPAPVTDASRQQFVRGFIYAYLLGLGHLGLIAPTVAEEFYSHNREQA